MSVKWTSGKALNKKKNVISCIILVCIIYRVSHFQYTHRSSHVDEICVFHNLLGRQMISFRSPKIYVYLLSYLLYDFDFIRNTFTLNFPKQNTPTCFVLRRIRFWYINQTSDVSSTKQYIVCSILFIFSKSMQKNYYLNYQNERFISFSKQVAAYYN